MAQAQYCENFRIIVEKIFNNWQDLKLAVEHGMGGRNGQKMAIQIMDYVFEYCVGNENITQGELQEVLEDLMNEEFNTVCDDGSTAEICRNLLRYKQMAINNQYNEIEAELSKILHSNNWLREDATITMEDDTLSESSSDSDSEADETQSMDIEINNMPASSSTCTKQLDKKENHLQHNGFVEAEPGWTIVRNKK